MRHCSFCSLLCSYENDQELADCSLRKTRLAELKTRQPCSTTALGKSSSIEEAIAQGREYLQNATNVLVTGRIASLETSRAALALAYETGATVDLADSQPAFDWLQAVQAGGAFTTTINEGRFRSDLIVLVGDESNFANHPRILHQLLDCPAPLNKRRLLLLGTFSVDFVSNCKSLVGSYGVDQVDVIQIDTAQLWNVFKSATKSSFESRESPVTNAVTQLQRHVTESQNAVFVFSTTAKYDNGIEVYRSLNEYILQAASDKKIAALPLSSASLMFSQCCTWTTGFPSRIEYVDDVARYNPWLCVSDKWIGRASNDALIVDIDDCSSKPSITIRRSHTDNANCLVKIPVAIGGVECASTLYKTDGSTMIVCGEDSQTPTAASVLALLIAAK